MRVLFPLRVSCLLLLLSLCGWSTFSPAAERLLSVEASELGAVPVYGQKGVTQHLVILFSSEAGLTDADRKAIDRLVEQGLTVAVIDTRVALQKLKGFNEACLYLPSPLEWISYSVQQQLNFAHYSKPLLVPAFKADFSIQVSGWFGGDESADAMLLAPEIARIDPGKLQCFYGTDEAAESLCLDPVMKQSEIISRPGGHHFDEDYSVIAEQISSAIQRRLAAKR